MDTFNLATDSLNLRGGDLTFEAQDITFSGNTNIGVLSLFGESEIIINADRFFMDNSQILNQTALEAGGGITVTAGSVELMNHSQIASQTFGDGDAGTITVMATDHVTISDPTKATGPSAGGLFTNSFFIDPGLGNNGKAGAIEVSTPVLTMTGGARINSTTETSGSGGDVTINAQQVSISGQRDIEVASESFGLGSTKASGIYTRTVGSAPDTCSDTCGSAGNVSISTGTFNLAQGARMDSGTTSTGAGGTITAKSSGNISISGTLDDGTPGGVFSQTIGTDSGSGAGGAIFLMAGQDFTLSNGATVSASSSGPANAGNITLTANDTILIDKATVATDATLASGGNIKLTANDTIQLVDSTIESSVQGGITTVGGDISLDPDFIILQNSRILAKAVQGQGGNISLMANDAVLVDPFSVLDASSALGISGSVNIQAPIQNLSGTIAPLPQDPVPVTALYGSRCVAGAGGHFSTFVDSKTDSLAPSPGKFLASPFLPLVNSSTAGAVGFAGRPSGVSEISHDTLLQVSANSPPVLFGHSEGLLTACP